MTREEALTRYDRIRYNLLNSDDKAAVDVAFEALREQGNCCKNGNSSWISVEDRLPEDLPENEGKKVIPCLVSLKSVYPNGKPNTQKRQRQLQYYGSAGWIWEWSRIGASRVTHWMPLPEPPEVEV